MVCCRILTSSPEGVWEVSMGMDPVSKIYRSRNVGHSSLGQATGSTFHNVDDNNASISAMARKYKLNPEINLYSTIKIKANFW